LPDQGSNLDSSGPKPDVLPVTPSGSVILSAAKLTFFGFVQEYGRKDLKIVSDFIF